MSPPATTRPRMEAVVPTGSAPAPSPVAVGAIGAAAPMAEFAWEMPGVSRLVVLLSLGLVDGPAVVPLRASL